MRLHDTFWKARGATGVKNTCHIITSARGGYCRLVARYERFTGLRPFRTLLIAEINGCREIINLKQKFPRLIHKRVIKQEYFCSGIGKSITVFG